MQRYTSTRRTNRKPAIHSKVGVSTNMEPRPLLQVIKEPYEYICQVKGKGVRLLLINAFDYWLHIPAEKKAEIGVLTQMLHNASLL